MVGERGVLAEREHNGGTGEQCPSRTLAQQGRQHGPFRHAYGGIQLLALYVPQSLET